MVSVVGLLLLSSLPCERYLSAAPVVELAAQLSEFASTFGPDSRVPADFVRKFRDAIAVPKVVAPLVRSHPKPVVVKQEQDDPKQAMAKEFRSRALQKKRSALNKNHDDILAVLHRLAATDMTASVEDLSVYLGSIMEGVLVWWHCCDCGSAVVTVAVLLSLINSRFSWISGVGSCVYAQSVKLWTRCSSQWRRSGRIRTLFACGSQFHAHVSGSSCSRSVLLGSPHVCLHFVSGCTDWHSLTRCSRQQSLLSRASSSVVARCWQTCSSSSHH
jgi:hypothetical protein